MWCLSGLDENHGIWQGLLLCQVSASAVLVCKNLEWFHLYKTWCALFIVWVCLLAPQNNQVCLFHHCTVMRMTSGSGQLGVWPEENAWWLCNPQAHLVMAGQMKPGDWSRVDERNFGMRSWVGGVSMKALERTNEEEWNGTRSCWGGMMGWLWKK